jgi:hypothetical protein
MNRILPPLFRLCDIDNDGQLRAQRNADNPSTAPSSARKELAVRVPFFLRAWCLREYSRCNDFTFDGMPVLTCPVGPQYTDPFCDPGSADTFMH